MCVEYSSLKGPATTQARPAEHSFFKALGVAIKTRLDKSTRENGFMYVVDHTFHFIMTFLYVVFFKYI